MDSTTPDPLVQRFITTAQAFIGLFNNGDLDSLLLPNHRNRTALIEFGLEGFREELDPAIAARARFIVAHVHFELGRHDFAARALQPYMVAKGPEAQLNEETLSQADPATQVLITTQLARIVSSPRRQKLGFRLLNLHDPPKSEPSPLKLDSAELEVWLARRFHTFVKVALSRHAMGTPTIAAAHSIDMLSRELELAFCARVGEEGWRKRVGHLLARVLCYRAILHWIAGEQDQAEVAILRPFSIVPMLEATHTLLFAHLHYYMALIMGTTLENGGAGALFAAIRAEELFHQFEHLRATRAKNVRAQLLVKLDRCPEAEALLAVVHAELDQRADEAVRMHEIAELRSLLDLGDEDLVMVMVDELDPGYPRDAGELASIASRQREALRALIDDLETLHRQARALRR